MFCLCLLTAFSCIFRIFLVSLPKEFLKKGYNMALKIKNREEAIAVLRDMVQRKKEMEKQVQEEFAKVRKEAELKKGKEGTEKRMRRCNWRLLSIKTRSWPDKLACFISVWCIYATRAATSWLW